VLTLRILDRLVNTWSRRSRSLGPVELNEENPDSSYVAWLEEDIIKF
jgi:hypothetical protein